MTSESSPRPPKPASEAEQAAEAAADHEAGQRDGHGGARAVDDAAQHVAAERIGAEHVHAAAGRASSGGLRRPMTSWSS